MAITINGKPGVTQITELTVGSSADLASVISDESGTGVLAFTNSPIFHNSLPLVLHRQSH
jgi:hypothetical protein